MSTSTQTLNRPALLEHARAFASRKHDRQKGKRLTQTYFDHLETVVQLLKEHGEARAEVRQYLHDCLEKTDTDVAELIREFGEDIAELVYWLTDPEDSEGSAKQLLSAWLLARAPIEAKLIKLADIADNADAIRHNDPARWPRFREGKGRILDRMAAFEGKGFEQLALFLQARAALAPIR
jgi:(p)ppGpp synthase/HD superfamily hydrolase